MDSDLTGFPSAITAFLFFILALSLSGILSGIKTVLGFYQKQNLDLALSADSPRFREWIDRASKLWKTPGFFESLSLARFLFEACALFYGTAFFLAFSISFGGAFFLAALVVYIVTHWGIPLLAQAQAPSLGGLALYFYRIYSLAFMGWACRGLYNLNEIVLRRLGH